MANEQTFPVDQILPPTLPQKSVTNHRIVNGYVATEGQFPYQVAVLSLSHESLYYICGGSIISREWVLSAAHCTYPHRRFLLRFGSNQLWANGELQRTTEVVNHPEYNQDTLNNDVSLLKIQRPLNLENGRLSALRLPPRSFTDELFVGNRSRIAGWGIDNTGEYATELNFVDMEIIDNPSCRRIYGERLVIPGVLCAYGFNDRRQGLCGGDSGSALVVRHKDEWVQAGIGAFGALDACKRGFPSGFARVTTYVDWIKETAGFPADDDNDGEVPPIDNSQEPPMYD